MKTAIISLITLSALTMQAHASIEPIPIEWIPIKPTPSIFELSTSYGAKAIQLKENQPQRLSGPQAEKLFQLLPPAYDSPDHFRELVIFLPGEADSSLAIQIKCNSLLIKQETRRGPMTIPVPPQCSIQSIDAKTVLEPQLTTFQQALNDTSHPSGQ